MALAESAIWEKNKSLDKMAWWEVHFRVGFLKIMKDGNDKTIDHRRF